VVLFSSLLGVYALVMFGFCMGTGSPIHGCFQMVVGVATFSGFMITKFGQVAALMVGRISYIGFDCACLERKKSRVCISGGFLWQSILVKNNVTADQDSTFAGVVHTVHLGLQAVAYKNGLGAFRVKFSPICFNLGMWTNARLPNIQR